MYSSLFSFLSCKLDDISAYRDGILEMVQPILPTLVEFLSTLPTELSNISWHFASDILRSTESNLFQEYLLKNTVDAVGSIFGLDNQTNAYILGNIALVFYDVFKVGLLNFDSLSSDDFEVFITVFTAPLEKESSIEISDVID
ncbi:hypothetical protein M9Y10_028540 [Tritrichomonas musculus]|uniref:Uncharacterized protein n=1 Tax=Tritrichomonas musculus TaxID=1915356 RepID=A0ABR2KLN9_9EUKA